MGISKVNTPLYLILGLNYITLLLLLLILFIPPNSILKGIQCAIGYFKEIYILKADVIKYNFNNNQLNIQQPVNILNT